MYLLLGQPLHAEGHLLVYGQTQRRKPTLVAQQDSNDGQLVADGGSSTPQARQSLRSRWQAKEIVNNHP